MKKTTIYMYLTLLFSLSVMPVHAAETIRYHGSTTVVPVVVKASIPFQERSNVLFDIKSEGSSVGIEKLLAGECDMAGVGRPLTDELKAQGVVATKLFTDAYAIVANEHVPVDALNHEELRGILTGKNVSWNDFAPGNEYTIKLVAPPVSSAHYKNFQQRFGIDKLPSNTEVVHSTPQVVQKVGSHPRAIGWMSYATIHAHRHHLKILGIKLANEVVNLDHDSVVSKVYPYTSEQYIYTMGEPSGKVRNFIHFIKSESGKKIVIDSGFFIAD